ncbi:hypothetical protein F5Y13DRAFT_18355 [Hypoxylon sp. FL1857]|nr:hypothetical protein F5Y13DRAFT_18355 [Hypoxylon sp. FL1857]
MTPISVEKGLLGKKAAIASTQTTRRRHRMVDKMPSARNFFVTLFLGLLVMVGLANAMLNKQHPSEDSAESEGDHVVHRDDSTFSRLLSSASPQALHEFLHAYFPATYKHGIYDSDRSAMEVVHANDPELATSIVQLAKRQSGNDNTTSSVTTPTSTEISTVTSTTESSTSQDTSTQETSSASATSPSETTVVSTATPTTSTETETPTTPSTSESTQTTSTPGTSADSSTEVSETTMTTTSTSTSSNPSTPVSSSSSSSSSRTSSRESTFTTTTTPSSTTTTRPPRTSTFTSTLPGGAKTTITSVEVVTPGAPEEASTTSGSQGSLQSGLAVPVGRKPVVEIVIGAVVGGALFV